MKRALTILFSLAAVAHAQFAVMHTNGVVISPTNLTIQQSNVAGLSNALAGKLGFNPTNGEVSWTNTNALTFTNRFRQTSDNATNPAEIRLVTKSNAVASWFYYDAASVDTNPQGSNWSVTWLGNNHIPSANGLDRVRENLSKGAISLTMENMYYAPNLQTAGHVGEFYLNIDDYATNGAGTTRAVFIVGSQTNSSLGQASIVYPVTIAYNSASRFWAGGDSFGLNVNSTNSGLLARLLYNGTNASESVLFRMQVQDAATDFFAFRDTFYIRNYAAGRNAFRLNTNGVIYGATGQNDVPLAPVHLAGNTRIDGSITFNNTTNAATTRTNLGLGNGITTNVSSGTLQFSNGILVGHTP